MPMLTKFFRLFVPLLLIATRCEIYGQSPSFLLDREDDKEIVVHNRILAKVNQKAITVMDVMRKMDMVFFREFPEYSSVPPARYQFYMGNWKGFLQDLINKELILADAEENKLNVNNGEVRQEMEQLFGPNIISNLDKAGLTMEEAWKMVQTDIMIRRMLMYRVNSKAWRQVYPQDVKQAYEQYAKEHVQSDTWVYAFMTIRDPDENKGRQWAERVYQFLVEEKTPFEEISEKLRASFSEEEACAITFSKEFQHKEQDISPEFKKILQTLTPDSYSLPVLQKSRNDNTRVYRIFYLKEMIVDQIPAYGEMAASLKDRMVQKIVDLETDKYINKLRRHFGIDKEDIEIMIPENFQPFSLESLRF